MGARCTQDCDAKDAKGKAVDESDERRRDDKSCGKEGSDSTVRRLLPHPHNAHRTPDLTLIFNCQLPFFPSCLPFPLLLREKCRPFVISSLSLLFPFPPSLFLPELRTCTLCALTSSATLHSLSSLSSLFSFVLTNPFYCSFPFFFTTTPPRARFGYEMDFLVT